MNVFRFASFMVAAIMFCAMPNPSQAREMRVLSYQELLEKSDLVVIAIPAGKTTDTKEQSLLPNIWWQDKNGKRSKIESIGVETVFAVSAVLKGDKAARQFTLHHYRKAQIRAPGLDEPFLVVFDPSDLSQRSAYLPFLVREPDGRFAPTGSQTDPGHKAISRLPFESNQADR
jgi:hypothetical protein